LIVQTPEDFQQWLRENERPARAPAGASAIAGAALFQDKTCGSCHRIRGSDAAGDVGPDLTHLASRKTLVAGMMMTDETNLLAWLTDPQKIKPGAHMPDFLFKEDSIHAIADYLSELK
jgi:cytochrome c oxidase subunit 2